MDFGGYDPMKDLMAALDGDDSGNEADSEDNGDWQQRRRRSRKRHGMARATDQFEAQHVLRGRAVSDAAAISKHEDRNRDYRRVEHNTSFFLEDSDDERHFTRDQRRLDRVHMERYEAGGWDAKVPESELSEFDDHVDAHRTVTTKKRYSWVKTEHDDVKDSVRVVGRGKSKLRLMALKQKGRDIDQPRRFHHPVGDGAVSGSSSSFSDTDISTSSSSSRTSSSDTDTSTSSSRSRSSSVASLPPIPVPRPAPVMRRATAADFGIVEAPKPQKKTFPKLSGRNPKSQSYIPKKQPQSRGRGGKASGIKQPKRR